MDKELYILRHGETDLNKQGIIQGRGIDSDLNATGREQAARFFARYQNIPFDKVYTSMLKRTQQTVQQFIDAGIPWEKHAGLDELAWGEWEGKQTSEKVIGAFKELTEKWQAGEEHARFEGGESPLQVAERLNEFIQLIKDRPAEKLTLICMHGRALRLLMCLFTGRPLSAMYDFPHQNTGLYRVRMHQGEFTLTAINNTDHLNF